MLLIGTDSAGAKKAADRLIRGIRHKDGLSFSIDSSVTAYQGESAEDTLLRASHDASTSSSAATTRSATASI